jgi:hypothetical protein
VTLRHFPATSLKGTEMQKTRWSAMALVVLCAVAVLVISACTSKSAPRTANSLKTAAASDGAGSHIDVMCIGERINDPPEPFHYSFKYSDASSSTSKEADITPKAMDITIKDASGTHSYHGVRSDEASWDGAVLDLSSLNMTAMMARLDALNDTSAISRQASEAMNGYDTTRYAIDSTKESTSDQEKFAELFGKGAFEKATVWVGADGCAVKLILDERISQGNGKNGNLKDDHYELARIRK